MEWLKLRLEIDPAWTTITKLGKWYLYGISS